MTELRKVPRTWFNLNFHRLLLLLKSRQFIGNIFYFIQSLGVLGEMEIFTFSLISFSFSGREKEKQVSISHLVYFPEVKIFVDVLWRLKSHKLNSPVIRKYFPPHEWEFSRYKVRIYFELINDLLHHCRGGNLTSQFVEHANCPLFSVQMKIHRSNNGIFAVPPQKQHSEGKSQGKLFDIVNFFFFCHFLTVMKVMNWIYKLENWKGKRWMAS